MCSWQKPTWPKHPAISCYWFCNVSAHNQLPWSVHTTVCNLIPTESLHPLLLLPHSPAAKGYPKFLAPHLHSLPHEPWSPSATFLQQSEVRMCHLVRYVYQGAGLSRYVRMYHFTDESNHTVRRLPKHLKDRFHFGLAFSVNLSKVDMFMCSGNYQACWLDVRMVSSNDWAHQCAESSKETNLLHVHARASGWPLRGVVMYVCSIEWQLHIS